MQFRMIAFGRIGANVVQRLLPDRRYKSIVCQHSADQLKQREHEGAYGMVAQMVIDPPPCFEAEEIIVIDNVSCAQLLQEKGIHYLDVGTSLGIGKWQGGYCQRSSGGAPEN